MKNVLDKGEPCLLKIAKMTQYLYTHLLPVSHMLDLVFQTAVPFSPEGVTSEEVV